MNLSYLLFGVVLVAVGYWFWRKSPTRMIKRFVESRCEVKNWERYWGRPVNGTVYYLHSFPEYGVKSYDIFEFMEVLRGRTKGTKYIPNHWIAVVTTKIGDDFQFVSFLDKGDWSFDPPTEAFRHGCGVAWITDKVGDSINFEASGSDKCHKLARMILEIPTWHKSASGYMLQYSLDLIGRTLDETRGISNAPVFKRLRLFSEMGSNAFLRTHTPSLPELPERSSV